MSTGQPLAAPKSPGLRAGGLARAPEKAARPDRLLTALLALAALGAVLQITVGGVVRVSGSGLGCPDWPLCHGSIVPVFRDYHVALEWSHRATGMVVGLTLIAATARALLAKPRDRTVVWGVGGTLALIAVVGGLGAAVVLTELSPALRTIHLGLAEGVVLTAAFTWAASAYAPEPGADAVRSPGFRLVAIAGLLVLASLLSGSYAVWRGAGAVCPSWPLCGGPVLPASALTWIHVTHRVLAGLGALLALAAAIRAYRSSGAPKALKRAALAVLGLVVAQVIVGAANPWSGFDQWARALHLSFGTMLWLALIVTGLLILRPVPRVSATQPVSGPDPAEVPAR